MLNQTIFDINFYISSFSKNHDNLSMWRLYADNGNGIVLGVDPNFPLKECNVVENPHISAALYDDKKLTKFVVKLCEKVLKILKSHDFKKLDLNKQTEYIFSLCKKFSYALVFCLISKNKSFEHEDEVRLLLYDGVKSRLNTHPNGFDYPSNRFNQCISKMKYCELDDELNIVSKFISISKQALSSAKLKKEFLKEVWIGSKLDDSQISRIQRLLIKEGYSLDDTKINKIILPYR